MIYQLPTHFPHLNNNCSLIKPLNECMLNIQTVTENVYDAFDIYDTGGTHSSAKEMPVEMVSRQVIFQVVDGQHHNFNQTDHPSLCALIIINMHSIGLDKMLLTKPKKDMTNLANKWSLEMIFIYLIRLHCGL